MFISAGYGHTRSGYVAGPYTGVVAIVVAAYAARLPFGAFHAWWPGSRLCLKLYKLQLSLSRKVLIVGDNQGTPDAAREPESYE